jgi:hypothetical protein
MYKKIALMILSASLDLSAIAQVSQAPSDEKTRLLGDVGLGLFHTGSINKGVESSNKFLPFINATCHHAFNSSH